MARLLNAGVAALGWISAYFFPDGAAFQLSSTTTSTLLALSALYAFSSAVESYELMLGRYGASRSCMTSPSISSVSESPISAAASMPGVRRAELDGIERPSA